MKHYIIVTDTNSRQYLYEIKEGFSVKTTRFPNEEQEFQVTIENPRILEFSNIIDDNAAFIIDNKAVFNSNHIVAVQYQQWEDDAR